MSQDPYNTEFKVELKGLKLPDDVTKRIESEIRQTVMKEIAKIDLEGDLQVARLPRGIHGIIIKIPPPPPPPPPN